ncbi:MAG: DUF3592 domain-containing protein [Opitutaceae bacterium]
MLPLKTLFALSVGYGAGLWCTQNALRKTRLLREAQFWLGTSGRILESRIHRDPQRNLTHLQIRYEFEVGERIVGNTPRLCGHWFWTDKQQRAFAARFQPGQTVEVYYDPRDPRRSCLDRADRSGIGALWVIALGGPALASLVLWLVVGD